MTESKPGCLLELYFMDGKMDGMLTAKVVGRTERVLVVPRAQIKKALARDDSRRAGIYLLLGERDGKPLAYIGETDEIGSCLRNNAAQKYWWRKAILATTTEDHFNKSHVKYLESRLVQIAKESGNIELDNTNVPPLPILSEAHAANMDSFLDTLLLILPALRIDMFLDKKHSLELMEEYQTNSDSPVFELRTRHGSYCYGSAILDGSNFIVMEGSIARGEWVGSQTHGISSQKIRNELERKGILIREERGLRFTKDYAFRNTSSAAEVILGRAASGPSEWHVRGNAKSYKKWKIEQSSVDAEVRRYVKPLPPAISTQTIAPNSVEFPIFELVEEGLFNATARGVSQSMLVIEKGSRAIGKWVGNEEKIQKARKLRENFKEMGILVEDEKGLIFTEDSHPLKTSPAASIIRGRASNGRDLWCVKGSNKTHKQWEEETFGKKPNTRW